ncbi:MAG: DNA repair protein RecN [Candidatus Fimenecus sp.]
MLLSLKIKNIAVIKETEIFFGNGFNVLTGETGAGKSIIIDSLNMVLGARTSKDIIRTGEDFALVSAEFDLSDSKEVSNLLCDFDIEMEDTLIISRKLTIEGKNYCRINGCPATVSMLKELSVYLVNIHGQQDNRFLQDPHMHLDFIDLFADNQNALNAYKIEYFKYLKTKKELDKLNIDEEQKKREQEFLIYQVNEIDNAELKIGESESLEYRRNLLKNSEKITTLLISAKNLLVGDEQNDGALTNVLLSADKLLEASEISDDYKTLSEQISDSAFNLKECSSELSDLVYNLDFDMSELDYIEDRLDLIRSLKRKYGATEEDILKYREEAYEKLSIFMNSDKEKQNLTEVLKKQFRELNLKANEISEIRKTGAKILCEKIEKELLALNMPSIRFFANFTAEELSSKGKDLVEFKISTNLGEEPKPLSKIASGGELSRIMLAFKTALDRNEAVTMIFDEIDQGVSGNAAFKIGKKLDKLSNTQQIICITHLAQLAIFSDRHFLIEKFEDKHSNRTETTVKKLDRNGKIKEIGRIMSGQDPSENILKSAEELLKTIGK